jgi:hypothetical protein
MFLEEVGCEEWADSIREWSNMAADWLTLVIRIQVVPDSDLVPEAGYPY